MTNLRSSMCEFSSLCLRGVKLFVRFDALKPGLLCCCQRCCLSERKSARFLRETPHRKFSRGSGTPSEKKKKTSHTFCWGRAKAQQETEGLGGIPSVFPWPGCTDEPCDQRKLRRTGGLFAGDKSLHVCARAWLKRGEV